MRCALYCRVSTRDGRQDITNQLEQLRQFAGSQHWDIAGEYIDTESGGTAERPEFRRLFRDAAQKRFDVVLFWALDRFSREGVLETLQRLRQLEAAGVNFRSYTEQYLDSCGLFRDAVLSILATIAKQERVRLSERTRAGLERAQRQGKRLGRPRRVLDREALAQMREHGMSYQEIARQAGVSKATIIRRIQASDQASSTPAPASAAGMSQAGRNAAASPVSAKAEKSSPLLLGSAGRLSPADSAKGSDNLSLPT